MNFKVDQVSVVPIRLRRFLRSVLMLLAWPLSAWADAEFTTGVLAGSDGAAFHQHTTPQIARLGDGRLMAVMIVRAKQEPPPRRIGATYSSDGGRTWSNVQTLFAETAKDRSIADPNMLVDGNQVFIYWTQVEQPNLIKRSWVWGIHSTDNGATWSQPREIHLPRQYIAGKQHNAIKLANGTYAMGISWDRWPERGYNARTEGETNISSGILLSSDGFSWNLFGDLNVWIEKVRPSATNGLAEPAIVQLADDEILLLLRSGGSRHYEARSRDGGVTWSDPKPSALVGHSSPTALWRVENSENDILGVWNNSPIGRRPLSVALSSDGGRTWSRPQILSTGTSVGGGSYAGITQAPDGTFVVVWQEFPVEGGRETRYARFNREWVLGGTAR